MTYDARDDGPAQNLFDQLGVEVTATASGAKSSEGDGRTAADVRAELEAAHKDEESDDDGTV